MDDRDSSEKSKVRLFGKFSLSDTILVASIPAIAYSIVFVYNWGYLDAFDLPPQFITFEIADILFGLTAILGFSWVLFGVFNVIFSFVPKDMSTSLRRRLRILIPLFLLFVAYFLLYTEQWQIWTTILGVTIVAALIMFLPPLFNRKLEGSYVQRMELQDAQTTHRDTLWEGSLVYRFAEMIGPKHFAVLVSLSIGLFLVYNVGRSAALNQRAYRVATTSPESVVLYITRDKFICAQFDRNTKEIEPSFFVLDSTANPNVSFRLEYIGPLKVKRPTQSNNNAPTPTSAASATVVPMSASPTSSP